MLNADAPMIGVLVDETAGEELRRKLGLGEKYTAYRRALRAALENDAETRLVEVRVPSDADAAPSPRSGRRNTRSGEVW